MKVGVAISDVIAGLYAAASALAGLHARGQGRGGSTFDLALADCTLASLVNVAQSALITGQPPARYGNAHPQIVPYEAFATLDGTIVLAIGADRQWQRFCTAIARNDWGADARFATNPLRVLHRQELIALLKPLFATRTTAQWQAALTAADVPHAPVRSLDEVFADSQVAAREMVAEAQDSEGRRYKVLAGAVHWQGEPRRQPTAPPAVGEHTAEVLREWLGYEDKQIELLLQAGARG